MLFQVVKIHKTSLIDTITKQIHLIRIRCRTYPLHPPISSNHINIFHFISHYNMSSTTHNNKLSNQKKKPCFVKMSFYISRIISDIYPGRVRYETHETKPDPDN
jgi:hypothetical protein